MIKVKIIKIMYYHRWYFTKKVLPQAIKTRQSIIIILIYIYNEHQKVHFVTASSQINLLFQKIKKTGNKLISFTNLLSHCFVAQWKKLHHQLTRIPLLARHGQEISQLTLVGILYGWIPEQTTRRCRLVSISLTN